MIWDREVGTDERLEVSARTGLVSQNVQDDADQSITDEGISRVGRRGRDGAELLGGRKRAPIVTCHEAIDIQPIIANLVVPRRPPQDGKERAGIGEATSAQSD